ncbi:MAG: hypothetical protein PHQ95_01225 [Candidatus Gracilibacteria bacterium]|nr:hypothetical protein [Candidatus Gracilibacteria bacterium]
MDKIKDKSINNSFFGLEDTLFGSPLERAKLHLDIAKNFFILLAFFYFFVLLMVLGGMFVKVSAQIAFFIYPLFVFSCLALFYNICSYLIVIYLEKYLFLRYTVFIFCSLAFLYIIGIHLNVSAFLYDLLNPIILIVSTYWENSTAFIAKNFTSFLDSSNMIISATKTFIETNYNSLLSLLGIK